MNIIQWLSPVFNQCNIKISSGDYIDVSEINDIDLRKVMRVFNDNGFNLYHSIKERGQGRYYVTDYEMNAYFTDSETAPLESRRKLSLYQVIGCRRGKSERNN